MKKHLGKQRMSLLRWQKQKLSTRQIAFVASSFFLMVISGLFLYFNFSNSKEARAAVAGDFRSIATGNWNAVATWERFNGSAWVAAVAAPLSTDGTICIQSGHTVSVTTLVTGDQVVVDAGGTLTVGTAGMTLANGTGSDLIVNGVLNISNALTLSASSIIDVNGLATIKAGGSLSFLGSSYINVNGRFRRTGGSMSNNAAFWSINNGGTFEHAINGGSLLPSAVWKTGSTCDVTGITTTMPSNINQIFHHFNWNCPNQTAGFDFNARFDWVKGNLTIISTGAATLQFDYQGNNNITNIGGNLIIQGGTSFGCANGSGVFNIGGNYEQTGGVFAFNQAWANAYGSTSITLNITGNLIMSGGMMDMTQSTANNASVGKGHINLTGNIYLSGTASLTQTSADSHGEIVFTGTTIQTYDLNNLVTNKIDFIIDPGATVRTNLNVLTSDGIFTLLDGGHLLIASPEGITQTSMQGNVQVTGTRTYGTGADYTYEGASVQVTGDGLPATVRNLSFDNSNNVTLTKSTSATNIITFTNGKVITQSNELGTTNKSTSSLVDYTSSKYVVGNLRRSVNPTGSYDFPVGVLTNYELGNINLSSVAGFTSVLSFFTNAYPIEPAYPLTGINVNGQPVIDMLNYGYWTFTPNSVMSTGTYTVTLNERGHTNSAIDPKEYCVLKRNNITSFWQSTGTHNDNTQSESGGTATAARSALTAFSHFGIGIKGPMPLPVTIISFTAKVEKAKTVLLNWSTAAEVNNNYFTIERSQNGKQFSELTKVDGAGTSTSIHNYSFSDDQPLGGTSYYRLKQTDFDGKSETFNIVPVNIFRKQDLASAIRVSPNPFTDSFTAEFESAEKEQIHVTIFTINGESIHSEKIAAEKGNNLYRFSTPSHFKAGSYILSFNNSKTIWPNVRIMCRK